jgi:hypothetical protein
MPWLLRLHPCIADMQAAIIAKLHVTVGQRSALMMVLTTVVDPQV